MLQEEQELIQASMIEELRQIRLQSLQLELRAVKLGIQLELLSTPKNLSSLVSCACLMI